MERLASEVVNSHVQVFVPEGAEAPLLDKTTPVL